MPCPYAMACACGCADAGEPCESVASVPQELNGT